jgi:hypothetical protein
MTGIDRIGGPRVENADVPAVASGIDPLRFCVMTTVALLAWLLGPPAVAAMSAVGFVAYSRAIRGGLTQTRCVLRHPRLVLAYLGVVFLIGVAGSADMFAPGRLW